MLRAIRRRSLKKTIAVLFILSFLVNPCQAADPLTVTRCIDGDTLELSNGKKVRLIGIDISTKMNKEAAEFTRKLVEGKQVRLEYDVKKQDSPIYKRTLAYVFVDLVDGKGRPPVLDYKTSANWYTDFYGDKFSLFVNATLIKAGYAQVMTVPPNVKYQELFMKLEKKAREQKRGLWK